MMTKDVLLTISGLHYDEFSGREDDNEPIEVITPGIRLNPGQKIQMNRGDVIRLADSDFQIV